jgi:hypothetical protein
MDMDANVDVDDGLLSLIGDNHAGVSREWHVSQTLDAEELLLASSSSPNEGTPTFSPKKRRRRHCRRSRRVVLRVQEDDCRTS